MLKAILFDLDDTLLGNDIDKFIRPYFALLGRFASQYMDEQQFMFALQYAAAELANNIDPQISNRDAFWTVFREYADIDIDYFEKELRRFYAQDFEQLKSLTTVKLAARKLVKTCLQRGFEVVIATSPMFPREAIEARLAWAGIPAAEYPYTLITTYENMHAAKPHSQYYQEVLDKINRQPGEALMVGNSWSQDIVPASAAGLFTYWIQLPGAIPEDDTVPTAYGSLDDLYGLVQAGWLENLTLPLGETA